MQNLNPDLFLNMTLGPQRHSLRVLQHGKTLLNMAAHIGFVADNPNRRAPGA
jgi:hypothetical protein